MKTKILTFVLFTLQLGVVAGKDVADDLVAHEWGTFTTVQGADGVQLEWNPHVTAELPGFVYDRGRIPRANGSFYGSKSRLITRVRMETPVIYFYSGTERTVDVNVRFPDGLVTEWFPQVSRFGPYFTTNRAEAEASRQSLVRWDRVQVLPQPRGARLESLLPSDLSGNHYYAARETDSDLLRVPAPGKNNSKFEYEKFLFYRGVGYFEAPLQVTMSGDEYVHLRNNGKENLSHFFVLNIRQGQGTVQFVDRLSAGEQKSVRLDPQKNIVPLSALTGQIRERMQAALVQEGLQLREAAAMVKTWHDSWLAEEGLRVLYILPPAWTDRILPLEITPRPREVVRVMVGRSEVITPAMEWQVLKQIVRFAEGDSTARRQAAVDFGRIGLGRFAEPAIRKVLGRVPSREFSEQAQALLQAAKEASRGKTLLVQR